MICSAIVKTWSYEYNPFILIYKVSKFYTARVTLYYSTGWSKTIFMVSGMKILLYIKNLIRILKKICSRMKKYINCSLGLTKCPSQNCEPIKCMPWDYDNYIVFTVSLNFYILIFTKLTRNMYWITRNYY